MPTIDLTEDELAAVVRAIRHTLDEDKFPHAPRLETLRRALAKLDPASVPKPAPPRTPLPQARRDRGPGSRR